MDVYPGVCGRVLNESSTSITFLTFGISFIFGSLITSNFAGINFEISLHLTTLSKSVNQYSIKSHAKSCLLLVTGIANPNPPIKPPEFDAAGLSCVANLDEGPIGNGTNSYSNEPSEYVS